MREFSITLFPSTLTRAPLEVVKVMENVLSLPVLELNYFDCYVHASKENAVFHLLPKFFTNTSAS